MRTIFVLLVILASSQTVFAASIGEYRLSWNQAGVFNRTGLNPNFVIGKPVGVQVVVNNLPITQSHTLSYSNQEKAGTDDYYYPNIVTFVCQKNNNTNSASWVQSYLPAGYVWPEFNNAVSGKNVWPVNSISGLNEPCQLESPCAAKANQESDPILVNLPFHAQYYQTVGICKDGCLQKPSGSVILDKFASDNSGYAVGPWAFTGGQCTEGVTPGIPQQPTPEQQCAALRSACESQCEGRAYTFDCSSGGCECFGAPGYTVDPPKEPTTPATDPGSPTVPAAQTPATDPGGDPQLGAQIANQGKQLGQGDAQLGQLGGINNKLSAVIANQGKQLGQGDDIIDYQRRQLGALEDIRNKLNEEGREEAPSLPGQGEYDTSIPDTKNWTEHDNHQQVGSDRAAREIQGIGSTDSPLSFNISTSGATPALSGSLLGHTVEIRFDRPWMLTGYNIMKLALIGLGYLQVFLMINRTFTGSGGN